MSEKPDQSVADRLRELTDLIVRATTLVNSIPIELQAAPVSAAELATIRAAETPEQQANATAGARNAARHRLKQRLEESVRVECAMGDVALRVLELLQLVRHVRGRAAEYARDGGNAGLDEIERMIAVVAEKGEKKKPIKMAG